MIEPLTTLWPEVTGEALDARAVRVDGDERALPGPFRVTLAASSCVAATTLAAARLFAERGGEPGRVRVDARHAAEAFRSERWLRVGGKRARSMWLSLSGDYRAADGWVKLHCNYPHHAEAVLAALDVPADRKAVARAVADLSTVDVEAAVLAAGGAAAAGTDVLVGSYRPDSLAAKGFGPAGLAGLRPGIVVVSLSAYGHSGPWRTRRGFDSLVQMSSGIADEGARVAGVAEPRPLPAQALDHATGWLAAFGVLTALRRRAAEGGSWHVRLSLARTASWLDGLGRTGAGPEEADPAELMSEVDSPFGRLAYLRVPGSLPGAEPYWSHGPRLPGGDASEWCYLSL